ncbi:MAG TPA: hypothetical protein VHQ93_13415 [Chitinophagaceae bacterium]|nr:hypothetical protein [Chitinophagaceae bacterium]
MKNLAISCLLLLAACSKRIDQQDPSTINNEKETCSFGLSEFNMVKRPTINMEVGKGKPGTGSGGGTGTTGGGGTTVPTLANVILLDFDGQYVANTMWNVNGPITCAPANLTSEEAGLIFQRVVTDFTPFNLTVTTDEAVFNAANPAKRMRVVITESWEWYGQAGGVSYLNSFTWGDNSPCFVFSSLLGYSVKQIAEACSHEAGHTLGLRHQSSYDVNGVKLSEYNWGQGSGEIGWAPIMGASYNENLSLWHYGPNSLSATTMQDDVAKIATVVGFVNDEYANSTASATALSSPKNGLINSSIDVDFFSVNINATKTISLIPANVGPNNDGGNLDLVLKIYNSQGTLLSTINDPLILDAGVSLPAGSYYVSASTTDNQFTTRYGMLSKYTIGIN